jgi:hypothetical protein
MRVPEGFTRARANRGFGCGAVCHEDVGRNAAKAVDKSIPGGSAEFL